MSGNLTKSNAKFIKSLDTRMYMNKIRPNVDFLCDPGTLTKVWKMGSIPIPIAFYFIAPENCQF